MDTRVENFFKNIKGKRIAFCGIGVSNLPLTTMFAQKGAVVYACDRKSADQLGEAAEQMQKNGVILKCGDTYLDDLDVDIIFRAPGMYYNMPKLQEYRNKGVVVTSEMEVFFDLCPARIYAITGSDGKTTTTTLISEMLKKSGKKVYIGGNIGKALLPLIEEMTCQDYAVVELSSFQLISMRKSPDVALITNVAPNHLDVHGTMEEYIESKLNLIIHQNAFSKTVLNLDNEITFNMADKVRGELCHFSRKSVVTNGAYCDENGDIYRVFQGDKQFVMNKSQIKLPGEHNVENYIAAVSAVGDEVSVEDIVYVAENFGGVEHRIELVRTLDGVSYYNDSIATSPTRTIAGLKSFGRKIIVIAGGYDKHIPYEPLAPYVNEFVKVLILTGATADKIEAAVKGDKTYCEKNIKIIRAEDLEQAVKLARENAVEGDVISLSPASASFDKYRNFEERGIHFKNIVNGLQE
ncbi:MAG: UDP-N-acetylmuramoyl-L-alanine--D-glutamate ligase [Clostridia bacterium]|nr:UDP-N-acetylmuramoyl-L-alanine--D-glutamate ligase [Clostridia bacterium]